MKPGRINKRERMAEQLRKKRAQTACGLTHGAKKPVAAVLLLLLWPRGLLWACRRIRTLSRGHRLGNARRLRRERSPDWPSAFA